MKFLPLVWGYLICKKQRAILTVLSVAIAFLLFYLLVATGRAFSGEFFIAGADRLLVMNKSSRSEPLPISYLNRIASIDGMSAFTTLTFFNGYYQDVQNPVPSEAVAGTGFLEVNLEFSVSDEQKAAWLANRAGALVGADLAEENGWTIGDRVPIQSYLWRRPDGDNVWEVDIEAIYHDTRENVRSRLLFLHYDYLNEGRSFRKDSVDLYQLKVADANKADEVVTTIDAMFTNAPVQTKTLSEYTFTRDILAQFADVGAIVIAVSSVVFLSLVLAIGSAMGHAVRERAGELAVLRVLGFGKVRILALLMAESILLMGVGGVLGLLASLPITKYLGSAQQALPGFTLFAPDIALGLLLTLTFGVLVSLLPGLSVIRSRPVDTLRSE